MEQQTERLAEIQAALASREDKGSTHWPGCETSPRHRDCAIAYLVAEVQSLRAERDQAKLQLGQLRLCVTCGRTRDASVPREQPDADCVHPEHGAPCLYDMTPMEAWQHWRQIAHDRGEELRQAQQRIQQLQVEREKTNG